MLVIPHVILEIPKDKINLTLAGQIEIAQFPEDVIRDVLLNFYPNEKVREPFRIFMKLLYDECKKRNVRPLRYITEQLKEVHSIKDDAIKEEARILKGAHMDASSSGKPTGPKKHFCKRILDPIYEFHDIEHKRQQGKFDAFKKLNGYDFPNPHFEEYVEATNDTSIMTRVPCGYGHETMKNIGGSPARVKPHTVIYETVAYTYSGTYDFQVDQDILNNKPSYVTNPCVHNCKTCQLTLAVIAKHNDREMGHLKQKNEYDNLVRDANQLISSIKDNEIVWEPEHQEVVLWSLRYILVCLRGPLIFKKYIELIARGPEYATSTIPMLKNFRKTQTYITNLTKLAPIPKEEVLNHTNILEEPFVAKNANLEAFETLRKKHEQDQALKDPDKLERLAKAAQFIALHQTATPVYPPEDDSPSFTRDETSLRQASTCLIGDDSLSTRQEAKDYFSDGQPLPDYIPF